MMLLGKKPELDKDSDKDSESKEESEDSLVASEAILDAIKKSDARLLDEALRSHYTLCEE
jgi:DNA-binding GntR family transcriptional regulator